MSTGTVNVAASSPAKGKNKPVVVDSEMIHSYEYHEHERGLALVFMDGNVYAYYAVVPEEIAELDELRRKGESVGRWIQKYIIARKPYKKVSLI